MQQQQQKPKREQPQYNLPKSYLDLRKESATARSAPKPHVLLSGSARRVDAQSGSSVGKAPRSNNERRQERNSEPRRAPQRVDRRGGGGGEHSGGRRLQSKPVEQMQQQQLQPLFMPPSLLAPMPALNLLAQYQRQFGAIGAPPPQAVVMQLPASGDLSSLMQSIKRVQQSDERELQLQKIHARQKELRDALAQVHAQRQGAEYDPCAMSVESATTEYDPLACAMPLEAAAVDEYDPLATPVYAESPTVVVDAELSRYMRSLTKRYASMARV